MARGRIEPAKFLATRPEETGGGYFGTGKTLAEAIQSVRRVDPRVRTPITGWAGDDSIRVADDWQHVQADAYLIPLGIVAEK